LASAHSFDLPFLTGKKLVNSSSTNNNNIAFKADQKGLPFRAGDPDQHWNLCSSYVIQSTVLDGYLTLRLRLLSSVILYLMQCSFLLSDCSYIIVHLCMHSYAFKKD
jgi:hypothetical protein